MMENDRPSVYDFESQLELGELLLGLGRVEEAELELRKARELNQAGSYSTPDDDPMRQEQLDRLAAALERVQEIRGRDTRNSRLLWLLATGLLTLALAAIFTSWMFNRAELRKVEEKASATAEAVETIMFDADQRERAISVERTIYVEEIIKRNLIETQAAESAALGILAATMAAEAQATMVSQQLADTQPNVFTATIIVVTVVPESTIDNDNEANSGQPTPTTVNEVTPTPLPPDDVAGFTQLRVTSGAANLRAGPGFSFFVFQTLPSQEVITLLGQSEDSYWYFVARENGQEGWVHASTSKPIALDSLPVFEAPIFTPTPLPVRPTTPPQPTNTAIPQPTNTLIPQPTNTAVPQPPTNTPIPRPTNTAVPQLPANTPIPRPTNTAVPQPPTNTPIPRPTNTAVPQPPTNTPIPRPTNTAIPQPPTNTPIPQPTNTAAPQPTDEPVTVEPVPTEAPAEPTPVTADGDSTDTEAGGNGNDEEGNDPTESQPTVTPLEPTPDGNIVPSEPTDEPPSVLTP